MLQVYGFMKNTASVASIGIQFGPTVSAGLTFCLLFIATNRTNHNLPQYQKIL